MKSPQRQRDHPQTRTEGIHIKKLKSRVEDGFNKLCIQNFPQMLEY